MANVSLRHVSKRFGQVRAVRDLSMVINDGEFVVLLGPSGAGKTTTLRLITGLEHPDDGFIAIDGRDVTRDPPGTRDIAFVFQQYSLYPHLTVYDNLAFPLRSPARRVADRLDIPAGKGVVVQEVKPQSFADDTGLQRGDVILEINKQPINSEDDFNRVTAGLKSGQDVVFLIRQRGAGRNAGTIFLAGTLP